MRFRLFSAIVLVTTTLCFRAFCLLLVQLWVCRLKSLYLKIIVLVGGVFIVSVLAILSTVYLAESRAIEQAGLVQAETLNRVAFEALYANMRQGGGRAGNQEVIERLREDDAFSSLRVVKGAPVIAQFGVVADELPQDELERRALLGESATEIVRENGVRMVHYAAPVRMQAECTECHAGEVGAINGVISTKISLESLDVALAQRRNYLLRVVGGSLLVLLLAVFYTVQRLVIRPLHTIRRGAAAIAHGDLSYRLDVRTGDEMELLSGELNSMVAELNDTYGRMIEEHNTVLASIESSHDAIWISDAEQRVVMVNPALEKLTGRSRHELLGQSCQYLMGMRSLDGKSLCDTRCPFLHPELHTGAIEGCMPAAAGKDAWVEISFGRVSGAGGELAQVVHIVHDLTERKEVEQLKDEFVSMVSHELRTPLHHIKGFATTLLQTDVEWDQETQRDFLESINHESDRLAALVEQILHLSRLEAGRLPMDREWHAVNDLIDGALIKPGAKAERSRFNLAIAPNLPPLFVDSREIETVLINLIENAIKYSDPDTPIRISAQRAEEEVLFAVTDQGSGIAAEDMEKIFDRFARVNEARHRSISCGLGLAICKRIVEAHNGRIWVESEVGVGSRFVFALPTHSRQPIQLIP